MTTTTETISVVFKPPGLFLDALDARFEIDGDEQRYCVIVASKQGFPIALVGESYTAAVYLSGADTTTLLLRNARHGSKVAIEQLATLARAGIREARRKRKSDRLDPQDVKIVQAARKRAKDPIGAEILAVNREMERQFARFAVRSPS